MKIYDKKGLFLGIGLILFGLVFLIDDLFIQSEIKADIFWPILLIVLGILDCCRCFSREKTKEHFIETTDERNKLVKLTSKARTLDIIQIFFGVVIIFSAIALKTTGNIMFGGMLITAGLAFPVIFIVELITGIYYEEKK